MGRYAIDIETISPDEEPSGDQFRNPEFFEILAVAVGYQEDPESEVEGDVLFRENLDAMSEVEILQDVSEWFMERAEESGDPLFTYNGTSFDMIHLRGRAKIAGEEAGVPDLIETLETTLGHFTHVDLKEPVWEEFGSYTKLEDACKDLGIDLISTPHEEYNHGMDPSSWRGSRYEGEEEVTGADVPSFGLQWLTANADSSLTEEEQKQNDAIYDMLYNYAIGDVEPLFEIADEYHAGRTAPKSTPTN